ncbi:hypothetical protein [Roseateles koreensis]|uniref:Uncharacterized protein n=1 Tax=Roseateles koreensis TaxID=2987526 RepID=A0ABT5KUA3_9BURK|nr:hypothetical protein [Roseateles koreensis]MDC8786020.1 hypothetical protein [Roseateles koreensis]
MIASISNVTDSVAASSVRPAVDESIRRRDTAPATAPSAEGNNSAVVEISSEGARRAAQAIKAQSAGATATDSSDAASASAASSGQAIQVSAATASAASATTATNNTSSTGGSKQYQDADTNHDGVVSVLEARAYDFKHPSIPAPDFGGAPAKGRSANAEVKVYEALARAGQSHANNVNSANSTKNGVHQGANPNTAVTSGASSA